MNSPEPILLLIEDNPTDVSLFQHVFRDLNLNRFLHVLTNGEEAIQHLGRKRSAIKSAEACAIFLDLNLPRKSGLEVLGWIRQQPEFEKTIVVVLTGSTQTIDIYRSYELGANSYLVKPISESALVDLAAKLNIPWLLGSEPPASSRSSEPPVHFPLEPRDDARAEERGSIICPASFISA